VRPTWAARAASTAGASLAAAAPDRDRIDYAVDPDAFRRVSWQDVARLADADPGLFRDRIVLVGGEFAGSGDEHRPTLGQGARSVSGLVLQALTVNTIMNGFPIRESGRAVGVASAGLIAGPLTFFILMRRRLVPALAFAAAATAMYLAAAFVVFTTTRVLWSIANPILAVGLALLVAVLIRARWRRPPEGARR
jgi:CHASE2 domain-containing sensor protein